MTSDETMVNQARNRWLPHVVRFALLTLLLGQLPTGHVRGAEEAVPLFGTAAACAEEKRPTPLLIGFTQLRTNLPGSRHANVRTMRAVVIRADGTQQEELAEQLADEPDAWTQFAGWSPGGQQAVVLRGWQDPQNAIWEEEHRTFRMEPGNWLVDACLVDRSTRRVTNVTAVDRVSHYNSGLFFLPQNLGLGFTAIIGGVSQPWVMDLNGHNKRDVSGPDSGFAYGFSASPDGMLISYHENYQLYVSKVDGSEKRHIKTGNPFNFAPSWSPNGEWLLFVSGEHYDCHPHIVRSDGTGLNKLADRNGYRGVTEFLDVEDFHGGSSDLPVWATDGKSVFYSAKSGDSGEMFRIGLEGEPLQLTNSPDGSLHYHPAPSPDGKLLLYGAKRDGVRQLFIMNLSNGTERQVTRLKRGFAAMWPHWQPRSDNESTKEIP
jgi:TolB protein